MKKITYKVYGRYALFSDPITRIGGEKFSYQVPTYQALKGITESIYWKPTFIWIIDRVKIINKIQTESKSIRTLKYNNNGSDLSIYTYLKDVEYIVEAHFEWNYNREDLEADRDENKHYEIMQRMIKIGGRRDIFLGTRECQAYVEPINSSFDEIKGSYDEIKEINFGPMFHGFDYPDENKSDENEEKEFRYRTTNITMKNGCIIFEHPNSENIKRQLYRKDKMKNFKINKNYSIENIINEVDKNG